jgi:guanine deaminase
MDIKLMQQTSQITGYRGAILDFIADPACCPNPRDSYRYFPDGLLLVANKRILALGDAAKMQETYQPAKIIHHPEALLLPGFIDCHVHYPQMEIIASYGEGLLDWLERYTFPAECKFGDPAHAERIAAAFIDELLRNGTTTALVMASSHPQAVDSLFAAAERAEMRLVSGLMMMDRFAPAPLLLPPAEAREHSAALIARWHRRGRLSYAITPRFAITSSAEGLRAAADLKRDFPDVLMHTHLAETLLEVEEVQRLFPKARSYFDVYQQAGLAGPGAVFAHSIYLSADDYRQLAASGSSVVHCPSSNLFLGSGLFNYAHTHAEKIPIGLGSDVGGGNSFSLLKTMADAYKVSAFHPRKLSPLQAFYAATLGGARCLGLEDFIGNFDAGKEADFIVLNLAATPLQKMRINAEMAIFEQLFAVMMLGDERNISATYVAGENVAEK